MTKDKINVYRCPECKGETVTVDVDEGVTPFTLDCRATEGCTGIAESSFYNPRAGHPPPAWEWYRPSAFEVEGLREGASARVGRHTQSYSRNYVNNVTNEKRDRP